MTTERIANMLESNDVMTSAQQDVLEACHFCEGPIMGEVHLSDDDMLEHFCSEKCVEKYNDNRAEAAYEHITSGVAQ